MYDQNWPYIWIIVKKLFIFQCFTKLDHRKGPWYASRLFEANKSSKAYNLINKFILANWRLQIKLYSKINSSYIKISAPGGIPTPPGGLSSSSSLLLLQINSKKPNSFQLTKNKDEAWNIAREGDWYVNWPHKWFDIFTKKTF